MTDHPVLAITWGPYHAQFAGLETELGAHVVHLSAHRKPDTPNPSVSVTQTDDPSEAGLRACIWAKATQQGQTDVLAEASPFWAAQFTPPPAARYFSVPA
jgi:hypothetical protein